MSRILAVIGTRPEAVKISSIIRKLRRMSQVEVVLCSTGQHKKLLTDALADFDVTPDICLDIMHPNQDLFHVTSHALMGLRDVISTVSPSLLLVHGDTSSTLAGALAGFYAGVPVGHIEAGLRTRSVSSPWPEEMNRRLVSQIATIHFAPTKRAVDNLVGAGFDSSSVFLTGNTVVDALYEALAHLRITPSVKEPRYVVITSHRRERREERLSGVCSALLALAKKFPAVEFKFVLHPSPVVAGYVRTELATAPQNITILPPLPYHRFLSLMAGCCLVITDSGGIQEEAPYLNKPVLILGNDTERMEAVDIGCSRLVGLTQARIYAEAADIISGSLVLKMGSEHLPFGDGLASERIVKIIMQNLTDLRSSGANIDALPH